MHMLVTFVAPRWHLQGTCEYTEVWLAGHKLRSIGHSLKAQGKGDNVIGMQGCRAQAGWQPVVYFKTAAQLTKAAWCLVPNAVLRRLTVVTGHSTAGHLQGSNLPPPSMKSISAMSSLLLFLFLFSFCPWP